MLWRGVVWVRIYGVMGLSGAFVRIRIMSESYGLARELEDKRKKAVDCWLLAFGYWRESVEGYFDLVEHCLPGPNSHRKIFKLVVLLKFSNR